MQVVSGIFVLKLLKSVNLFSSYSQKCWGYFLDTVYNSYFIEKNHWFCWCTLIFNHL